MSLVIFHLITKQVGAWTISTHSAHGSKSHDKKHVHITKPGLKGEYSWNVDGSRHDKHKFPAGEQCINRAKDLAASALNIPANTMQLLTGFEGGFFLKLKDDDDSSASGKIISNYVHKGKFISIFGHERGLIIIIDKI